MEPSSTVLDKPRKCLDFSIKFRVLALINSGGLFSVVTVEDISSPFPPCIFFVHSTNQASPIAMLAMPQETNFTVWEPIRSVRSIFPKHRNFSQTLLRIPWLFLPGDLIPEFTAIIGVGKRFIWHSHTKEFTEWSPAIFHLKH